MTFSLTPIAPASSLGDSSIRDSNEDILQDAAAEELLPHYRIGSSDYPLTREDVSAFGSVPIEAAGDRFRSPLLGAAQALAARLGADARVILLGSIATAKYTEPLLEVFGEALLFPADFVGRGDMSRGGLLLRAVDAGEALEYIPVLGASRRGSRPPKLVPRRWT